MSDNYNDIYSQSKQNSENQDNNTASQTMENISAEGSYEWNKQTTSRENNVGNEYHYSYVNGNNQNASHNPNNYENAYSSQTVGNNGSYSSDTSAQYNQNNAYVNTQENQSYNDNYNYNNQAKPFNTADPYAQFNQTNNSNKTKKEKKPAKPVSRGFVAAALAITVLASASLGFGGGYLASHAKTSTSNGTLNINKVDTSNSTNAINTNASTASAVVKKAANSVVEITTESVVTGSFARQYVAKGAGSGVIISEDGYIITNNHVIDGANSIVITLRDDKETYNAALIGTDAENDIALLKIDATGLSPATFGDSSSLAVGDYVVAIGNPLGELGGTVTDGIISALAREVTIEDQNMTLLQTNAEINPGNSGGGLFNANGELIGVVNAKDSATEVEGIGFAIPINNVLDIINDLKTYGYVTGKIELGMEVTDVSSNAAAFYYGLNNQKGCYVLSVTKGSNADTAGFQAGDLITKFNGEEVTSTSDLKKALDKFNVGDKVTMTVYRSGKTADLELTLQEYTPSSANAGKNQNQTQNTPNLEDPNSIWSEMFGW